MSRLLLGLQLAYRGAALSSMLCLSSRSKSAADVAALITEVAGPAITHAAEQAAISDCRVKGESDYRAEISYANGWGAMAVGSSLLNVVYPLKFPVPSEMDAQPISRPRLASSTLSGKTWSLR